MNILSFDVSGNYSSISLLNNDEVNTFTQSHDRKDRPDWDKLFSSIDFATNIFANNRGPSKVLTFAVCNLIKSSPLLQLKFLEKILGIYNYPYLSIGAK